MKKSYLFIIVGVVVLVLIGAGVGMWAWKQTTTPAENVNVNSSLSNTNAATNTTQPNLNSEQPVNQPINQNIEPTNATSTSQRELNEESCNTSQMFQPPKDEFPDVPLLVAQSVDGITFEHEEVLIDSAGVPSVTQGGDGKLVAVFNWFPDFEENPTCYNKVAIMTSEDEGKTWAGPFGLYVEEFPNELQLPFDPTITTTEDGTYRLFFTTHKLGMEEPFIYGTAVSDDGLHFTYDGIAFEGGENDVVDGSEVLFGDIWFMLAPVAKQDGAALQAKSIDGNTFELMESERPEHSMYWVGNMTVVNDAVRFYGSCGIDSGLQGLCYSATKDGVTWDDPVKTNAVNSDPGIVYTDSGNFILIYAQAKTTSWPEESGNRNL